MWAVRAFADWIQERNSIASDKCPVDVLTTTTTGFFAIGVILYSLSLIFLTRLVLMESPIHVAVAKVVCGLWDMPIAQTHNSYTTCSNLVQYKVLILL